MSESFFVAPKTLKRLRSGPSGPHVDGFASELKRQGYSHSTSVRYLRAAAHLGRFAELRGVALSAVDQSTLELYRRHLPSCRCPGSNGGRVNPHVFFGAKLFVAHLRLIGLCGSDDEVARVVEHPLVVSFRHWLRQHRGVTAHTANQYGRAATELQLYLGNDPRRYCVRSLRSIFLRCVRERGKSSATRLATALRAFLRYLAVQGKCQVGLDQAIPTLAGWRLARLPRGLTASEVSRILAACDGDTVVSKRDRAMVLLLARLALRAGEVAALRLSDVDWKDGSLVVSGKARREDRLPLPQEVGDPPGREREVSPLWRLTHLFPRRSP